MRAKASPPGTEPVFVVTVDTEADNEWEVTAPASFGNVAELPRFQALCDRYGVRPTYLVAYNVAAHAESEAVLRELLGAGQCEIGAHMHAWVTPPYYAPLAVDGRDRAYLYDYPREVQFRKLAVLTDYLETAFEVKMRSHRGGRWGVDEYILAALHTLGYRVDSSVTPLISWRNCAGAQNGKGGPDYVGAPRCPYRPADTEPGRPGDGHMLEVPVTVGIVSRALGLEWGGSMGRVITRADLASRLVRGVLRRVGLAERVMLSPVESSRRQMLQLCRCEARAGAPVLNLALHSSELVPGGSPLVKGQREAERVWGALEAVFDLVAGTCGYRPLTLGEYAESVAREAGARSGETAPAGREWGARA